jgi:YggT family protein
VWSLIGVTSLFLKMFFFAMIISVILSWVAPGSHNPAQNWSTRSASRCWRRSAAAAEPGRPGYLADLRLHRDELIDMLVIGNLAR